MLCGGALWLYSDEHACLQTRGAGMFCGSHRHPDAQCCSTKRRDFLKHASSLQCTLGVSAAVFQGLKYIWNPVMQGQQFGSGAPTAFNTPAPAPVPAQQYPPAPQVLPLRCMPCADVACEIIAFPAVCSSAN